MRQNSVTEIGGEVRDQAGLSQNEAKEKDESTVGGKGRIKLSENCRVLGPLNWPCFQQTGLHCLPLSCADSFPCNLTVDQS